MSTRMYNKGVTMLKMLGGINEKSGRRRGAYGHNIALASMQGKVKGGGITW